MSLRRLGAVFRQELSWNLLRPLTWIWVLILGLTAFGLSTGNVQISTGDTAVGGQKAWITSEFAVAQLLGIVVFLFYGFFLSVAAGMAVIRDEETQVDELLRSTPLRPSEYAWGKFLALLTTFLIVLAIHVACSAVFNHAGATGDKAEVVGPFAPGNYLRPTLWFAFPQILFLSGVAFFTGAWTRRPMLVFVLPVMLLASTYLLWEWSPVSLAAHWNTLLMAADPSGVRWLSETWIDVDRGVEFYNSHPIGFDATFLLSRAAFASLGLLAVLGSTPFVARRGGSRAGARSRKARARADMPAPEATEGALRALGMRTRPSSFPAQIAAVARVEWRELRGSPGLYLFVPLILLQIVGTSTFAQGVFDTPILATSGQLAARAMNTVTLLVCFLLLFYTVESMERERRSRLGSIAYAAPLRTSALVFGKALANGFVGLVVMAAAFLGCAIVIVVQGQASVEMRPFALLWVLLLGPTFLLWCAFASAVWSVVRNRYTAYAVCLAALILTGYHQVKGNMTWVWNWDLWGAVGWSDIGPLELDRRAIVFNRLLALFGTALFTAVAVRFFPRREADPVGIGTRLRPGALARAAFALAPFALPTLAAGIWLDRLVDRGTHGDDAEKLGKDYWKQNIATWKDAKNPSIARVDVALELEPARSWLKSRGTFELVNMHDEPLRQFALTGGSHWQGLSWTLDGQPCMVETRTLLHVFTPAAPLAKGARAVVGFEFEGGFPAGISKNGARRMEFVTPSSAVLTSFGTAFVPLVGYSEQLGVDEDNRYEPKVYADDFYVGPTRSAFGADVSYPVRISITTPEEYTANSVGVLESDVVADGRRTSVWETDYPVEFFNVVCGRWDVRRRDGTAIYHHPAHAWNIEEMSEALAAARRWYSEWFYPFPWAELKLSEFPAHAFYAQGFPTNITFSEGIGFLTESDPDANAAFLVTAHESAHQWWGNLLSPGEGPGGNILSEGMSHFATILLFEQVKGLRSRIAFCEKIEDSYCDGRQVDSEHPLVKIDGSKAGDDTVTYDKGGWVFWMLLQHMGRERALAGYSDFLRRYHHQPDHPVLQDLLAVMREQAVDREAFDAFAKQWFFEVVMPQYELRDALKEEQVAGEGSEPSWKVTAVVANKGTGHMPVEIAAARGVRFPDEKEEAEEDEPEAPIDDEPSSVLASSLAPTGSSSTPGPAEPIPHQVPSPEYRERRATVVLGPGEERAIEIVCDFEPDELVVDPDALVLQLQRKRARAKL